jgi:hypothetical protein
MHAKEHASMSNESRPNELKSNPSSRNDFSTPNPFSPDWHHHYGAKLSAFPRYLVLSVLNVKAQFWPDLATFVEGPSWSAMMYYPGASRASVCIVHWPDAGRWEAFHFVDEDIVARASGASYGELLAGLEGLVVH